MADSAQGNDDTSRGSAKNTLDFDLSSQAGFAHSTEWIRNHVLLAESSAPMLELSLRVAAKTQSSEERRAKIFMDPTDGYVVGFRGSDAVYMLHDEGREIATKLHEAKLLTSEEQPVLIENIGTDHRSLGTFQEKQTENGLEVRTFGQADLRNAGKLSGFSQKSGVVTNDGVRNALSLLVCMTSESARSRTVEVGFQRLYMHARVQPDSVMQSYDQAKRITRYAEAFPNIILADRIEKLEKRSYELRTLIDTSEKILGQVNDNNNQQRFLEQAIQGTTPKSPEALANAAQRIRGIAKELNINHGSGLSEILSLCKNNDAIRAAKDGVIVPPIKKRAKGASG